MLRSVAVLALISLAAGACSADPRRPNRRVSAARPDKAELFGDPGLVPTREGERARRELARAGEIEKAIEILPEVRRTRVDVEFGEGLEPARVLVVVDAAGADDRLEASARRIVSTIVGSDAADSAQVVVRARPEHPRSAPPSWALLTAVLALGVSLGISYERGRRVLAQRRRRGLGRRASRG